MTHGVAPDASDRDVAGDYACLWTRPGHAPAELRVRLDPERGEARVCSEVARCGRRMRLTVGEALTLHFPQADLVLRRDGQFLSGTVQTASEQVRAQCSRRAELPVQLVRAPANEEVELEPELLPEEVRANLERLFASLREYYASEVMAPGFGARTVSRSFPEGGEPASAASASCGERYLFEPPDWAMVLEFAPGAVYARYGFDADADTHSVVVTARIDTDCDGDDAIYILRAADDGEGQLVRIGGFTAINPDE